MTNNAQQYPTSYLRHAADDISRSMKIIVKAIDAIEHRSEFCQLPAVSYQELIDVAESAYRETVRFCTYVSAAYGASLINSLIGNADSSKESPCQDDHAGAEGRTQ